jgi:hypothetical protein
METVGGPLSIIAAAVINNFDYCVNFPMSMRRTEQRHGCRIELCELNGHYWLRSERALSRRQ